MQFRVDPEIEWLVKVLLWSLLALVYLALPARLVDVADSATRTWKRALLSVLLVIACFTALETRYTYMQAVAWLGTHFFRLWL